MSKTRIILRAWLVDALIQYGWVAVLMMVQHAMAKIGLAAPETSGAASWWVFGASITLLCTVTVRCGVRWMISRVGVAVVIATTLAVAFLPRTPKPTLYAAAIAHTFLVFTVASIGFILFRRISTLFATGALHVVPGSRARGLLSFAFHPKTMALVFDPVLADMQSEWLNAVIEGNAKHARWIQVRGYWCLFQHLLLQFPVSFGRTAWELWKTVAR